MIAKSYAGVQRWVAPEQCLSPRRARPKKRGGDREGTPPSSDVTESALWIAATLLIVLIGLGALLSTTWLLVLLLLVVGLLLLFRLLFVLIRLVAVLIAHGSLLGCENPSRGTSVAQTRGDNNKPKMPSVLRMK